MIEKDLRCGVSEATVNAAMDSYTNITSLNIANRLEPISVPPGVVGVSRGGYNINEG